MECYNASKMTDESRRSRLFLTAELYRTIMASRELQRKSLSCYIMCSFLVTTPHHIPHTDLVENECSVNAKTPSLLIHSELDGL